MFGKLSGDTPDFYFSNHKDVNDFVREKLSYTKIINELRQQQQQIAISLFALRSLFSSAVANKVKYLGRKD